MMALSQGASLGEFGRELPDAGDGNVFSVNI
jgi:hypothetical protein